jgi:hypothetical protein
LLLKAAGAQARLLLPLTRRSFRIPRPRVAGTFVPLSPASLRFPV